MLRPYQKAYLKSLANTISHRYLLGKGEVDEGFLKEINAALEAKELIKVVRMINAPHTSYFHPISENKAFQNAF